MGFMQFVLPALLEFLGSGLQALGIGSGGQEVRSFGRVPLETLAQNLGNFTSEEFRRAQALRDQPITMPGRDISEFLGPASISGLPSGTVGLFPQLQQFAQERTFPGSALPADFDPGDGGDIRPPGDLFGGEDDRERGPGGGDDDTGEFDRGGDESMAQPGIQGQLGTQGQGTSTPQGSREQAIRQTMALIQRVLSQGRLA